MTINLTQHIGTPEQGVVEPMDKAAVQRLLTFDRIPSPAEMRDRAWELACIAKESGATQAMVGGAPFFMSTLEQELQARGIVPVYAFSVRESADQVQTDGSVRKVAVFKHVGFVEGSHER